MTVDGASIFQPLLSLTRHNSLLAVSCSQGAHGATRHALPPCWWKRVSSLWEMLRIRVLIHVVMLLHATHLVHPRHLIFERRGGSLGIFMTHSPSWEEVEWLLLRRLLLGRRLPLPLLLLLDNSLLSRVVESEMMALSLVWLARHYRWSNNIILKQGARIFCCHSSARIAVKTHLTAKELVCGARDRRLLYRIFNNRTAVIFG